MTDPWKSNQEISKIEIPSAPLEPEFESSLNNNVLNPNITVHRRLLMTAEGTTFYEQNGQAASYFLTPSVL
jgi:hypothetical protein